MLRDIAAAADITVEDIVQDFIESHIQTGIVTIVIDQYKKGNLKARKAWKMTGLSYQEFQSRASM